MTELEQQLQEQVDKLNGRLAKAAQVFKTQKADVERLTQEKVDAEAEADKFRTKNKELESRLVESSKSEETIMEQAEQLSQLETDCAKLKSQLADAQKANEELDALKSDAEKQFQEMQNKNKQLQKEIKQFVDTTNEVFNSFKETAKSVSKLSKICVTPDE